MYNYNVNEVQNNEAYRQATQRVKAKMGFYGHLASYVIVNAMMIVIYLFTSLAAGGLFYPWFIWTMLPWGIGLAFHFLGVFVFGASNSPYNRQRMVEAEMRKMGATTYDQSFPTDRK